ncbi:MAG: acyl-CoA dehydrogenase [Proteobacteria bacterium]|nr:acyl-CoA dehydrogenase [Pseudomonadota bacterium]
MDFELSDDQRAICEAVDQLLAQHAGAARAIELGAKVEYDAPLDAALAEAGFRDVARGEDTGPLEAALIVEAVARAGGVVALGAGALVGPGVRERELPGPLALASTSQPGPVRYAAHARTLLVLDGDDARVVALEAGEVKPVPSSYGYPMGDARGAGARLAGGDSLGAGSGERLSSWWRVALAVEAAGTMQAALDVTVDYLKERRQFGRSIGSFQAVQHRLAECAILVEGSRWLAYEAAFRGAPPELAATASAYALRAAAQVFRETHQLSGAIGYTREHDLHVWSMRLQALRLELGGVEAHCRAVFRARWGQA